MRKLSRFFKNVWVRSSFFCRRPFGPTTQQRSILSLHNQLTTFNICDVLLNLIPFVQFKIREKTPLEECYFLQSCRLLSCNFSKSSTPPWVLFTFFKLCKWYQLAQRITIKCQYIINRLTVTHSTV